MGLCRCLMLGLLLVAASPLRAWQDGDLKAAAWLPGRFMQYAYDDLGRSPHVSEAEVISHLVASLNAWRACGLNLEYVGKIALGARAPLGITVIRWSPRNHAAGWARVNVVQGAIQGAAIELATEQDAPYSDSLKNHIFVALSHEIGHTIGLRHSPFCDAVMGACGQAWNRLPTSYDIWSCKAHYSRPGF